MGHLLRKDMFAGSVDRHQDFCELCTHTEDHTSNRKPREMKPSGRVVAWPDSKGGGDMGIGKTTGAPCVCVSIPTMLSSEPEFHPRGTDRQTDCKECVQSSSPNIYTMRKVRICFVQCSRRIWNSMSAATHDMVELVRTMKNVE